MGNRIPQTNTSIVKDQKVFIRRYTLVKHIIKWTKKSVTKFDGISVPMMNTNRNQCVRL